MEHRTIRTNGIDMHVVTEGEGPLVVCCHGFPELWYSWRHQIPVLAREGYRVVVPDQRGYGDTDRPEDVEAYDIVRLTDDLVGLLDALGTEQAVFAGHDWGAAVVWNLALLHPDRVRAVMNLSVPLPPRSESPPTEVMRAIFGDRFFYQLYFQEVGPADREFDADPRRSLRLFYGPTRADAFEGDLPPAEGTGALDLFEDTGEPPPWLTPEEFDVYAKAFEETGFSGGLNWYRNLDRNWELTGSVADRDVTQPTLFMAGSEDAVLRFMSRDTMRERVRDLRDEVIVDGAGHWLQQERPHAVNEAFVRFLRDLGD